MGDDERGDEWFANRPRGILSPKERKHLMGMLDEDLEEDADAIRQREYRIRQHIRHSLIDFQLLSETITPNIANMFFGIFSEDPTPEDDLPVQTGIESLFDFLYMVIGTADKTAYSSFHRLLSNGIESALVRYYANYKISVTPNARLLFKTGEHVPLDAVERAFENGEDFLLVEEQEALYWAGRITYEERNEHRDKQTEKIERLVKEGNQEELNEWVDAAEARRTEAAVDSDDSYFSKEHANE